MPAIQTGVYRVLLLGFLVLTGWSASAQPTAITTYGPVVGTTVEDGKISVYRGIPFAQPPLDSLRWRAPQPPETWQEPRVCTTFAASPFQRPPQPFSVWSEEFLIPPAPIDEDCLYLNVWARSDAEQQPVLVWIYGGGFNSGGAAVPIYDGTAMAREGVVFVSINYRVGPFGFMAHPELSEEAPYASSGNYGLMDQIAALHWVRDNIAAFGGDPNRITIAGQSAGSASVHALVASPLADGLFHRAIAQSGGFYTREAPSLADAEDMGLRLAERAGAQSLQELRALPAAEVLAASTEPLWPVVDGYLLPQSVVSLTDGDDRHDLELLTGWNENEASRAAAGRDAEAYQSYVRETYGDRAEDFLEYYPAGSDSVARQSQMEAARDLTFGIQNYGWANLHAGYSNRPVYVYRFTREVPGEGEYAGNGAFHSGEIPYAYGTLDRSDRPWTDTDRRLSATMLTYWVNFVKHGNPNAVGLPRWPTYSAARKNILYLGEEVRAAPLADAERLDFMLYLQGLE